MNFATRWTSLILGAVVLSAPLFVSAQEEKAPSVNLDSELAKESYAAGTTVAKGITGPGVEIDLDSFLAGFTAAFKKQELAMSEDELRTAFMGLQKKMQEAAQKKQMEAGSEAMEEGQAYLDANAKKEGVKVTESGLQYKVITEGDGPTPGDADKVKVHYTGTFINGEKFDSSVDRGEPAEFGVTQVIKGWTEALQMMKVGAKWELAIPSALAYGPGRPGIPPNSTLLFEVELLEIVK
jgi:FKBP-type peptidyl-prolyl cis-trans isomerase